MFIEGSPDVAWAMQEKKFLIERRIPERGPRILGVGCGGFMYGTESGGAVTAWNELGFGQVLDVLVCFSTSSPKGAYQLSGNPRVGTSIYYEECCTARFLSPWRWRCPVDTGYLCDVFRGSTGKGLNVDNVLRHRTEFLIGVTNANTGHQRLVRPRTAEQLFTAIQASISVPGVTGASVGIDGRPYIDGSYSNPLPIKFLVKKYNPTHIVVFSNSVRGFSEEAFLAETILYETLLRTRTTPLLRALLRGRNRRLSEALRWVLEDSGIPTLVAWSGGQIGLLTRNPQKLQAAAEAAEAAWTELLTR